VATLVDMGDDTETKIELN